jgi:hypothetical protein
MGRNAMYSTECQPTIRNQHEESFACCLLQAGFLFSLIFNSEDRGNIFLQKSGWLSKDYIIIHAAVLYGSQVGIQNTKN